MNERRDEKIERLERRVLKANRVTTEELREIVAAPHLFEKINERIKAAQKEKQNKSGFDGKFSIWNLRKIGLAFGVSAVFLTAALGLIFFSQKNFSVSHLSESVAAPKVKEQIAIVEQTSAPENKDTENRANRNAPEKAALKKRVSPVSRRGSLMKPARKTPATKNDEPEAEFYPLAFAENLEEAKTAGQIIRVELSRSSLLALGVNPPAGDENLKIKTDLLIGSDGVAQGIRFVK